MEISLKISLANYSSGDRLKVPLRKKRRSKRRNKADPPAAQKDLSIASNTLAPPLSDRSISDSSDGNSDNAATPIPSASFHVSALSVAYPFKVSNKDPSSLFSAITPSDCTRKDFPYVCSLDLKNSSGEGGTPLPETCENSVSYDSRKILREMSASDTSSRSIGTSPSPVVRKTQVKSIYLDHSSPEMAFAATGNKPELVTRQSILESMKTYHSEVVLGSDSSCADKPSENNSPVFFVPKLIGRKNLFIESLCAVDQLQCPVRYELLVLV